MAPGSLCAFSETEPSSVGDDPKFHSEATGNGDSDDVPLLVANPDIPVAPKRKVLWMEVGFVNIILLGVGFMLSIGAYQTAAMVSWKTVDEYVWPSLLVSGSGKFMEWPQVYWITCPSVLQTVVLNSVNDEWFHGTPTMGYICLAINCGRLWSILTWRKSGSERRLGSRILGAGRKFNAYVLGIKTFSFRFRGQQALTMKKQNASNTRSSDLFLWCMLIFHGSILGGIPRSASTTAFFAIVWSDHLPGDLVWDQ